MALTVIPFILKSNIFVVRQAHKRTSHSLHKIVTHQVPVLLFYRPLLFTVSSLTQWILKQNKSIKFLNLVGDYFVQGGVLGLNRPPPAVSDMGKMTGYCEIKIQDFISKDMTLFLLFLRSWIAFSAPAGQPHRATRDEERLKVNFCVLFVHRETMLRETNIIPRTRELKIITSRCLIMKHCSASRRGYAAYFKGIII